MVVAEYVAEIRGSVHAAVAGGAKISVVSLSSAGWLSDKKWMQKNVYTRERTRAVSTYACLRAWMRAFPTRERTHSRTCENGGVQRRTGEESARTDAERVEEPGGRKMERTKERSAYEAAGKQTRKEQREKESERISG